MRLPYAIRTLGSRLLQNIPLRIRKGPCRGFRWSLASSGRGYVSGTFDAARVEALVSLLRPGDRVLDLGAHKGYVALAAARAVGEEGHVTAVEPAEQNLRLLKMHLEWNDVTNVSVVPVAVSGRNGEARFGGRGSTLAFELGEGERMVPTRTVARLIDSGAAALPDMLKVDIEGQEAAALRHSGRCLHADLLAWISIHSRELLAQCREILEERDFTLHPSAALRSVMADPGRPWEGDEELLAAGPGRSEDVAELQMLELFRG